MLIDMIRNLLSGGPVDFLSIVSQILATLFVIFCILPLHEFAHAWVASKLGDNTARYGGRLSLNPLVSFDPFGALFLLLFGFGWAKPVPIDARYFKKPKRDMALTALAGPVSNFLAAWVGALIYFGILAGINATGGSILLMPAFATHFFSAYVGINVALAVFNLIPLPPLDGSKILGAFLSDRALYNYYRYQNVIIMVAFVVLFSGMLDGPINFMQKLCLGGVQWLALLPYHLFGAL